MPFEIAGARGLVLADVVAQVTQEVLAKDWSTTGAVKARYIPPLSMEPDGFGMGILVFDPDTWGQLRVVPQYKIYTAGDVDLKRTIQSAGKVLMATLAMQLDGDNSIWAYAGESATHAPFDDTDLLRQRGGRPPHPFGNAGAILTGSRISRELWLESVRQLAGNPGIDIDGIVAVAEQETCDVNRAAGFLMRTQERFTRDVDVPVDLYCEFCSTRLGVVDMLRLYAYLGNGGIGLDGNTVLPVRHTLELLQVLGSTGAYEETVQLMRQLVPLEPLAIKTAVSGFIVLVCKGMLVVVCDPRKNTVGNSVPGAYALCRLAERFAQARGM